MVSKVSERLKEKMVIRTTGILEVSSNKEPNPAFVNITPNAVGSTLQASANLLNQQMLLLQAEYQAMQLQ